MKLYTAVVTYNEVDLGGGVSTYMTHQAATTMDELIKRIANPIWRDETPDDQVEE